MKRTLFFAFCILHFTFAAPAPAQTTTFLRAPAAAAYSPLDGSPTVVLANHRIDGYTGDYIFSATGSSSGATDFYDVDDAGQYKTSSGGSWIDGTTETWTDVDLYDQSGNSHTAIASGPTLVFQATGYPYFDLDGSNDYWTVADADDLSFGNGTTDSPFSVVAYVNPDKMQNIRLFFKETEYILYSGNSKDVRSLLYDDSASSRKGRKTSAEDGGDAQGDWTVFGLTYDGSGGLTPEDGQKTYIDVQADNSDNNANTGTYTAMENSANNLVIGAQIGSYYTDGKFSFAAIYPSELSSTVISNIDTYMDDY